VADALHRFGPRHCHHISWCTWLASEVDLMVQGQGPFVLLPSFYPLTEIQTINKRDYERDSFPSALLRHNRYVNNDQQSTAFSSTHSTATCICASVRTWPCLSVCRVGSVCLTVRPPVKISVHFATSITRGPGVFVLHCPYVGKTRRRIQAQYSNTLKGYRNAFSNRGLRCSKCMPSNTNALLLTTIHSVALGNKRYKRYRSKEN
jgi:hypothetical protein